MAGQVYGLGLAVLIRVRDRLSKVNMAETEDPNRVGKGVTGGVVWRKRNDLGPFSLGFSF